MSTYQYVGIDATGAEVRGSTDAPNVDAARTALQAMHIEVREIHEATRSHRSEAPAQEPAVPPPLLMTFAFEGTEPDGNVRRGTIQAESKYQAFDKLHRTQRLYLSMLSPVGITPQHRDYDLQHWQKAATPPSPPTNVTVPQNNQASPPLPPAPPKRTLQFGTPVIQATVATANAAPVASTPRSSILGTVRLYAGWLLGWYGVFLAAGHYASERSLTWTIPFSEGLYQSPLILTSTAGIFLYLLFGTIHRAIGGRILAGTMLGLLWIILLGAFRFATRI